MVVDAPARNVIATQRGTSTPDEFYIICGHYDSISDEPDFLAPGADDNASGVALVLDGERLAHGVALLQAHVHGGGRPGHRLCTGQTPPG